MGTLPSPSGDVTPWKLMNALAEHYNSITSKNMAGQQSMDEDARKDFKPTPSPTVTSDATSTDGVTPPITPEASGDSVVSGSKFAGSDDGTPAYAGWKLDITGAPDRYRPIIEKAASDTGIPAFVLASQYKQESNFRNDTTSSAGATGIPQFMPGTAREVGVNPRDPDTAIPAAARYLARAVNRYNGNIGLGLAAYNWGSGNVDRWVKNGFDPKKLPAETRNYIKAITGQTIENWIAHGGTEQTPDSGGDVAPAASPKVQKDKEAFATDPNNRYSWLAV